VVDRAIETVQPLLSVKRQTVNREHASRPLVVSADAGGLGLAIVKQALEAHGQVSVRNVPGKGCVFSLNLPDSKAD
jgi:signal transduction histidine kinase